MRDIKYIGTCLAASVSYWCLDMHSTLSNPLWLRIFNKLQFVHGFVKTFREHVVMTQSSFVYVYALYKQFFHIKQDLDMDFDLVYVP